MNEEVVTYAAAEAREEPAQDPDAAGSRRRWPLIALVAALVLAGALAATFGLLWWQARETQPEDVRNYLLAEVAPTEERSEQLITLLLNYDATNIAQRPDEIRPLATGRFLEQYNELIGQGLDELLEEASSSSRGQIISGPDISFRSPSEAIALARVSQTAQSQDNPQGTTYVYVLKLTLVKTTEGWLADEVEILSEEVS